MKILIIRHADPDYERDTLTEKGLFEAELLARTLQDEKIDDFYLSPLGRAQKTAEFILNKKGQTGETLPWLEEFCHLAVNPVTGKKQLLWEMAWESFPALARIEPDLVNPQTWLNSPCIRNSTVPQAYKRVTDGLDALLQKYGYERDGDGYRAVNPRDKTIALVCHCGVQHIMLSHLLNLAPVLMMKTFYGLPSSVTTLKVDEYPDGTCAFQCLSYGARKHLSI